MVVCEDDDCNDLMPPVTFLSVHVWTHLTPVHIGYLPFLYYKNIIIYQQDIAFSARVFLQETQNVGAMYTKVSKINMSAIRVVQIVVVISLQAFYLKQLPFFQLRGMKRRIPASGVACPDLNSLPFCTATCKNQENMSYHSLFAIEIA